MPQFTPNMTVEANLGFDVVKPGVYRMRVGEITEFTSKSGNQCLKVKLEYVDPSGCTKLDGTPAKNPGVIFDNSLVTNPADKQGKLRQFCEACGRSWGSISNTDDLVGSEVDVKVKTEEYNGEMSNKADRYLQPN